MAEAPLTERLPRDFGKYRLEKRIATGGMAEVFLAHRLDEPLKPLVIKRILPHLIKSGDFVQMFLDEARIAAQLSHPNVVGILDIGQVEGTYYLAMEYVHGEDIRRIYNRAYKLQRSLPLSHSIRVIADAALGLGHAHKLTDLAGQPLGLVHRDVSPQNILVTYDGEAKVVDFGIAKAANKVAETRAGVLKGKYSYMSPEQALGEGIDHRTDIFALGIILYETTTGTRLFKRENELATLQAIIKCEYLPPSQALQNYPP
ncbi:MAG: serine/threonine protein kinase, partial [Myxococcales bacterium]|nr:serine/threonine protein kinase [Myxococcales bacterium]